MQRVLLFFRRKTAHFPVMRVVTRHLMIIRHDVNTKRDTTMGLGTDVHVERLSKISLLFSVLWCRGKVGLQYRRLSCLACWVPWCWPLLLLNLDWISPNDLRHRCHVWCYLQPELVLLVFHLSGNVYTFLQSGPFDDCNLLTVLLDKNSFFSQTVKIAAALLPSVYTGWDSHDIWLLLMQNLLKGLAWKVPFLLCGLFFWCYDRHPKIRRKKYM